MTMSSCPEKSPLILQPILYGGREASEQYIGGERPTWAPLCGICGQSVWSLARFRTANQKRRLHIVACTKASCWNELFRAKEQGNISIGGKGVVFCRVSAVEEDEEQESNKNEAKTALTGIDDWGGSPAKPTDMDSLEAQLLAIEGLSGATNDNERRTNKEQSNDNDKLLQKSTPINAFPRYEIYSVKEPNAPRANTSTTSSNKDSAKIQAMLDRYLAEETDEEIRNALLMSQQSEDQACVDETPTADRILFDYKERLHRAPRQVIRCGGVPLWSAPVILPKEELRVTCSDNEDMDQANDSHDEPPLNLPARLIPPCQVTGEPRHFTAQLLPTLLHSLRVDKTHGALDVQFSEGAMDFGNILIYTSDSSSDPTAVCIVQKPVDEAPTGQRKFKLANLPGETGSPFPNSDGDDQASTFTDGSVDDDFTIDGEDDGDELW